MSAKAYFVHPMAQRRSDLDRLVPFEVAEKPIAAIATEKQAEAGRRRKKVELIESMHSTWTDLADQL